MEVDQAMLSSPASTPPQRFERGWPLRDLLGGLGTDYGTGIAVDPQGASYVSGETTSSNFPVVVPFQPTLTEAAMRS